MSKRLKDSTSSKRALNNAYCLLRSRPRSEYEIRKRLKLKGYDQDVIEEVVARVRQIGDIDDKKFAKFFIESRMHFNPAGDIVLRRELKLKGIADSLIEEALRDRSESYDEQKIALNMAREKFERLKKLDRAKASKRLYDFLMRRGFRFDLVSKIIEELVDSPDQVTS